VSPVARNYKEGSVIYFEGDKNEEIYILKSGRVLLISQAVDSGEEVKEEIKTAEFFGVKSVLGGYRREETAQVLTQAVVLVFNQEEFEKLIAKNFEILMKLLRVFSNQLRRIGKKVRELLGKSESKLPATELFNIGEYYFRRGKKDQALYAYKKYQEFYPTGEFYSKSKERVSALMSGAVMSREDLSAPPPPPRSSATFASTPATSSAMPDDDAFSSPISDFMDEPGAALDLEDSSPSSSPASPSAPDFSSPLEGLESLGQEVGEQWSAPAPRKTPAATAPSAGSAAAASAPTAAKADFKVQGLDIAKKYYDGLSLFSQEKYQEAITFYEDVLSQTQVKDSDLKFVEKSAFEKSRCLIKLERWQDAVTDLTNLVRKFQKSDLVKEALFLVGECYEKLNNPQKAANFYQKVIGMPPRESINNKAKQRIEALRDKLG
jgi:tetratricopeptide (TPR) repeat protein